MSKVVAIMSMSLDGYVADLNDGVGEVFDWYMVFTASPRYSRHNVRRTLGADSAPLR